MDVISTPGAAIVALDPVRSHLLSLLQEPRSASELARAAGLPRQKVNYHLKKLEAQGLVTQDEARHWGGITERVMKATARAYVISPETMGPAAVPEPDERADRLSASFLLSLAVEAVRHIGRLLARSRSTGRPVQTFALDADICFASPAARADFARDLAQAVGEVVTRHHDDAAPGARRHRLIVGAYPHPETPGAEESPKEGAA